MEALLQQIDNRQLRLYGGLLLLLLTVALLTYAVVPQVKQYRGAATQHGVLLKASQGNVGVEQQLEAMRVELHDFDRMLHGDMVNLPAEQIEAFIIGSLQTISWRNGIELDGVRPLSGEQLFGFEEISFDVSVRADYFDLYRWLSDLNKELGFVVIKAFEMQAVDLTQETPKLDVKLTIASYRGGL